MPDDPVTTYQEAVREHDAKTVEVTKLLEVIQRAHRAFSTNWWQVRPEGGPKYELPIGIATSGRTIDLASWPTADDIARLLSEWHWLRQEVQKAWNAIPGERRSGLQEPKGYNI